VARDRQRSKQQRRRRPSDTSSQARDIGLGDSSAEDAGLGDGAPDPLMHASGEVEIAKAAEAGIPVEPPSDEPDDDDFERAPDELEGDLVPSGRGRGHRRGPMARAVEDDHDPHRKQRGRVLTFLRACVDELRRVQWPDRKHVFQATAVVLGFVLVAGGWLGLMDAIWQPVVNAIL
jgi:preprotein translocase subunit SecE